MDGVEVEAEEGVDALDEAEFDPLELDPPEPDALELDASLPAEALDSPLAPEPLLAVGAGALPLLRKSVTYQPLPLS